MIFISHSHQDQRLVDAFTHIILGNAYGIKARKIYCSSIPSMQFIAGTSIEMQIKEKMEQADLVIFMLTVSLYTLIRNKHLDSPIDEMQKAQHIERNYLILNRPA